MHRDELTQYLDDLLGVREIEDPSFNGIQFEGADNVEKVVCAVDAGIGPFTRAAQTGARYCIVHHGLFWQGTSPALTGYARRRLDILYHNNISLYACHLPLDRHPSLGNNAQLLSHIGADIEKEFLFSKGKHISFIGRFPAPTGISHLCDTLNALFAEPVKVLDFGKSRIQRVAVASGGAGISSFQQAVDEGVDVYITGEPVEIYHLAKDAGIHVIFGGHHQTETLGIKKVAQTIASSLDMDTEVLDYPTGL
jgi:dinuclear metal center YbgI/SA1388 family protein